MTFAVAHVIHFVTPTRSVQAVHTSKGYERSNIQTNNATFTPLVLSATGGLAGEANNFYKKLASMLAYKWDQKYSSTLPWLRCRLDFSLLRSTIKAIRGARSSCGYATKMPKVDLVNSESLI